MNVVSQIFTKVRKDKTSHYKRYNRRSVNRDGKYLNFLEISNNNSHGKRGEQERKSYEHVHTLFDPKEGR